MLQSQSDELADESSTNLSRHTITYYSSWCSRREVLNTKKSSVNNHIQSAKHKNGVLRLQQKESDNSASLAEIQ